MREKNVGHWKIIHDEPYTISVLHGFLGKENRHVDCALSARADADGSHPNSCNLSGKTFMHSLIVDIPDIGGTQFVSCASLVAPYRASTKPHGSFLYCI
ncbi:unnamed protein product [Sphenostylis stenocarpa]|uniref:Uncharacterized protein n=1 Tax=Sphenostylis stenocarpa TaxID=92480 RepID=A0AA86S5H6_9FABA|nr:unnamed protein product [Sphenostylis stenocarpa]